MPRARRILGLVPVGRDLVVVEAARRGAVLTWRADTRRAWLDEAPEPPAQDAIPLDGAAAVLLWPVAAMLRREIDIVDQDIDVFRQAVAENLSSFFPASDPDALRWDVHDLRGGGGRAALAAGVRSDALDPAIDRLEALGVRVLRVAPSALAYPLLLRSDEAPERAEGADPDAAAVLESTPSGWALLEYRALRWVGVRAGAGAPPAPAIQRADALGALRCDWSAPTNATGDWTAAHAALGAALLAQWPDLGRADSRPAPFDLLGAGRRRAHTPRRWLAWAGVGALVVASAAIAAGAWKDREEREASLIAVRSGELAPAAQEAEDLRAMNERILAVHERLGRLERGYLPRWAVLSAVTEALPQSAWVERLEIFDSAIQIDVIARDVAAAINALEESPLLERVSQRPGAEPLESGETRVRLDAQFSADGLAAPAQETGA